MKAKNIKSWGWTWLFVLAALCLVVASTLPSMAWGAMTGLRAHEMYIYPIVRVSTGYGVGSGSIIYSSLNEKEKYSTYVLTNFHVVSDAVLLEEVWDTDLQRHVQREKRSIVYVEIFKYGNISTPVGTLRVEADIVLYNYDEDMALLKLRIEDQVQHVALLSDTIPDVKVMDESVAVGCSLGFPPLPSVGVITRLNFQIDSLPYHMSCSQIIFGNSGGAIFKADTGELIGIPSLVPIVGWGTPITHMGLFIPVERIYAWLSQQHYDFIYNPDLTEVECLNLRNIEIRVKKGS